MSEPQSDAQPELLGPFAQPGNWYKGALHVHTNQSDARQSPDQVLQRYHDCRYDFVCLTDHDRITSSPAPEGMLVIPGIELACRTEPDAVPFKTWHFVGLGLDRAPDDKLTSLDRILRFLRPRSRFLIAAHPYWGNLSGEDLALLSNCDAVEVHNTVCHIEIGRGRSEPAWDYALSAGTRLFGVAVDDTHQKSGDDLGVGWVWVRAAELTEQAVLAALKAGHFYASTGPRILSLESAHASYSVTTSPCRTITFYANSWYGNSITAPPGTALASARYDLQGPETYLRIQCTDLQGSVAWSNPIYLP